MAGESLSLLAVASLASLPTGEEDARSSAAALAASKLDPLGARLAEALALAPMSSSPSSLSSPSSPLSSTVRRLLTELGEEAGVDVREAEAEAGAWAPRVDPFLPPCEADAIAADDDDEDEDDDDDAAPRDSRKPMPSMSASPWPWALAASPSAEKTDELTREAEAETEE